MASTNWIYLPLSAADLDQFADSLIMRDSQEAMLQNRAAKYRRCDMPDANDALAQPLAEVDEGDKLWVLLHGRQSNAHEVGAMVGGARVLMSVTDLAARMDQHGLNRQRRVDIKLYVCYAGLPRKRWFKKDEAPFGAQLYAALRRLGHVNKRVAGYRGAMQIIAYNTPHKLLSLGLDGPALSARDAAPESAHWSADKETFNHPGIARARDQKEWFDEGWFLMHRQRLPRALR